MTLIQLINADDQPIWLNPDHIVDVAEISGPVNGTGSQIHTTDGQLVVQQHPNEVYRLIILSQRTPTP